MKSPLATRPRIPAGYGVSEDMKGALRWISVRRVLEGSLRYWIATSGPKDGPHLVQQWAGWVDDTLYFGGSDKTRWSRHLRQDPRAAVSVERTGYSIMVEGRAEILTVGDPRAEGLRVEVRGYGYDRDALPVRSGRRGGTESKEPRALGHPRVVGHDDIEIVAEREGRAEMDRIERSHDTGFQDARGIEYAVGHGNELDPPEC